MALLMIGGARRSCAELGGLVRSGQIGQGPTGLEQLPLNKVGEEVKSHAWQSLLSVGQTSSTRNLSHLQKGLAADGIPRGCVVSHPPLFDGVSRPSFSPNALSHVGNKGSNRVKINWKNGSQASPSLSDSPCRPRRPLSSMEMAVDHRFVLRVPHKPAFPGPQPRTVKDPQPLLMLCIASEPGPERVKEG